METTPSTAPTLTIGILGGTGVAGSAVDAELRRRGHATRVLSRSVDGAGRIDLADPTTYPAALAGLDVLVDTINAGRGREQEARLVMVDQLRGVLAAAATAGARHVVSLSIIGAGQVPGGYYRVKVDQEAVVRAAALRSTIVRATQFHQLIAGWCATAAKLHPMVLPRGVLQPVDPREVAVVLADAAEAQADGTVREIAGPAVESVAALARQWVSVHRPGRRTVTVPAVGGMLRAVSRGALTDLDAPRGTIGFGDWLAEQR